MMYLQNLYLQVYGVLVHLIFTMVRVLCIKHDETMTGTELWVLNSVIPLTDLYQCKEFHMIQCTSYAIHKFLKKKKNNNPKTYQLAVNLKVPTL